MHNALTAPAWQALEDITPVDPDKSMVEEGPLMGGGGLRCHVSILRNNNVTLSNLRNDHVTRGVQGGRRVGPSAGGPPISHVDFKKWQCLMSLSLIFPNVT